MSRDHPIIAPDFALDLSAGARQISAMTDEQNPARLLRALFDRAVAVADPMHMLARHLPPRPKGRLILLGAGKASARMAEAAVAHYGPCEGVVITRYGHERPAQGVTIIQAAHPVPDAAGVKGTAQMLDHVQGLTADDLVIALISGGASALLCAPSIPLADKQNITKQLLASGAPIDQINILRKHLSKVKGGQLAAACYPARVLALLISDVPGDDPRAIGSGPTVGEISDDPAQIAARWGVNWPDVPSTVVAPDDPRLSRTENHIIAAPRQSLTAAADLATSLVPRLTVRMLGHDLQGEARDLARSHAAMAIHIAAQMTSQDGPILLLSGGECTVTRRGDGVGGPNAEYALALAIALQSHPRIFAMAADTDGIDGAAEVAGAIVTPTTLARAPMNADDALGRNDAHSFFAALNDQIITGPTLTNVNDFRAIWISAP